MSRSLIGIVAFTTLLPLAIEVAPDSAAQPTGETRFRVAGGYNYYSLVVTDCMGRVTNHVPVHAYDGAVAVDHLFSGTPIRVGVRGGWTQDRLGGAAPASDLRGVEQHVTFHNRYVNPFVDLERPRGGFGIGWIAHDHEFITDDEESWWRTRQPFHDVSLHVRLGPEAGYLGISWMEGMPIYSDGGYLNVGVGGQPAGSRVSAFFGLMGGPTHGTGVIGRLGFDATPALGMSIRGQTANSGGRVGSLSIALEYRVGPRTSGRAK